MIKNKPLAIGHRPCEKPCKYVNKPCVNELFYIFSMILPRFGRFGKDYFHNNNIVFIRGIVKMAFCISLINLLCFLWFGKFGKFGKGFCLTLINLLCFLWFGKFGSLERIWQKVGQIGQVLKMLF